MDETVTLQESQVGQRQMAAVEQLDLHVFVGRDVVGELHADLFPGRATVDEIVFQHPLHKGFADHRPGIVHPMLVRQLQAVRGAGHRRDAVDHGVGETDVGVDPVAQWAVVQGGEGQQGLAGDGAIVRQVIAGHQGEGRCAGGAAPGQCGTEQAEHGRWRIGVREVMPDLRQVRHELTGAVVDAVTAFGDGQRDDADLGAGQFVDQRPGVVFGQQHVADGPDHPHFSVVAIAELEQGEQVVLILEIVTGATVLGTQADTTNGPIQCFSGIHQRIGVKRLVGAMEAADADVRNALTGIVQRVGGQGHCGCEAVEVLFVEFHHRLSGIRQQRATGGSTPCRRHRINGSVARPSAGSGVRRSGWPDRRERAGSGLRRRKSGRGRTCRCPGVR
ncbi:hypothetical protein D3C72_868520 [compost metagenome]